MPFFRLFSVFVICCALTIAGCSKSSTESGLEKDDTDGDGIADIYDPDTDGDGIPNSSDPDMDGDGIPNSSDPDIDGDGKPNGKDPDPENNDPNYCDQIQVYGLNDEQTTGSRIELTWNLQSSKTGGDCVLKDDVKAKLVQVRASAAGAKSTTSEKTNPLKTSRAEIQIPLACTGETVKVTYDFTEIATLIKANPKTAGWTVKQRHKADPEACDTDGDGSPDFVEPEECPAEATGTHPDCICPAGKGYDLSSNDCLPLIAGVNLDCPIFAKGIYPICKCPDGQGYDVSSNACLDISGGIGSGPVQCSAGQWLNGDRCDTCDGDDQDECNKEAKLDFLDCSRKCETQYCSDQCVKWFGINCEKCNDCWPEKSPESCSLATFGIATVPDSDTDNDDIPNDSDSDVDGDGVPNTSDKDIDGDGIPNKDDLDIDGDGKINSIDPDADGDGTPDAEDDTPGGPR